MKKTKALFGILSITMALAVQVRAQSFLTNGLVAYYPFNGNANDASGNGNNGSLIGNDWKFSLDRLGQQSSLYLNTTSTAVWNLDGAYVSAPASASLDFTGDFTLTLWVNLSPITTGADLPENLISNGPDNASANLRIAIDNPNFGGKDYLQFVCGPGQNIFALVAPVRQTWWQVAVVHTGNTLSLFKNGSLLTNGVMTAAINGSQIFFGRHIVAGPWHYPLVGGIDDVRFYNRALSASEVQQLYAYESQPIVSLRKAVSPSFSNLYLGTNYQLQVSTDLSTWTNSGAAFAPTNTVMDYPQYWDVDNWNQLFFRLQLAP